MTWKNFIALPAIVPRRRVVASALVYGLSLSVRFTSATGEQVEVPALAAASIMARDNTPTSYHGWPLRPTEPISLQLGWPLVTRRCQAACERLTPMAIAPTCGPP
jgi:hypothetical protein